ncbi:MAG: pyruvate synthase subunit PorB [Candidatus Hadarchaeales archaeon]
MIPAEELLAPGHRACPGCGEVMALRLILKALGKEVIVVEATGCMEVVTTPYPQTAWRVPWVHGAFENAAAIASGVEAALKRLGRKGVKVVAIGGDGGTADIGLQALSGMMERGHNVLYVCTDNEAYMNTGIQRSGTTPFGAWTTTTPAGKVVRGEDRPKKDMPSIALAHRIPYVATASVGYPRDLLWKVRKAAGVEGPSYLHVHCPCPTGWRYDSSLTVRLARLAVETGCWILWEAEGGSIRLTFRPERRKPVREYLRLQGRFSHLTEEEVMRIQREVDERCRELGLGWYG